MLFFLLVLLLEKEFSLSVSRRFKLFYWHYNLGLLLTLVMMAYIGVRQLQSGGVYHASGMIAGISGVGHTLLAIGLGFFFVVLGERVLSSRTKS